MRGRRPFRAFRPKVRDHDMVASTCHGCGRELDAASSAGKAGPKPGDLTVCLYCAAPSVFDEQSRLRKPTAEELADPATAAAVAQYQEYVRRIHRKAGVGGRSLRESPRAQGRRRR